MLPIAERRLVYMIACCVGDYDDEGAGRIRDRREAAFLQM